MRIANCYLFDLHICADNLEIVDRTATASEPDDGHPGNPHRRRPTTPRSKAQHRTQPWSASYGPRGCSRPQQSS